MADDWKYSVEDFEDPDEGDDGAADDPTDRATDVFGDPSVREDLEPGSPSFENALFVVVGVALALLIVLPI